MEISVEFQDSANKIENKKFSLSLPALIKHIGFAGMGYNLNWINFIQGLGCVMYNYEYINIKNSKLIGFIEPNEDISDPTKKGQFSNIIGKAIGDFLSKRIFFAKLTINYEAEMRKQGHTLIGSRPDLYCIANRNQFAVECKGLCKVKVSKNDMKKHKNQSQKGPLLINFSVASVTYNIFKDLKVKYYDPINSDMEYNSQMNTKIIKDYYSAIIETLNITRDTNLINIRERNFYSVPISNINPSIFQGIEYDILVTTKIFDFIENGRINADFENDLDDNVYIDNDGIGIKIKIAEQRISANAS